MGRGGTDGVLARCTGAGYSSRSGERKSEEVRPERKRNGKRKSRTNSSVATNDEGAARNRVGQPLVMPCTFYPPCNRLYSRSNLLFCTRSPDSTSLETLLFRRTSVGEKKGPLIRSIIAEPRQEPCRFNIYICN